jgi:aldos-2-ulose dehydratase/isomerase family protein
MTARPAAAVAGIACFMAFFHASAASRSLPVQVTTLDADFAGGYQVCVADVDGNGRPDVIGLGQTVAWLRGPTWQKRPITGDQTHSNIDLAPYDVDGDGKLDVVVASDFSMNNTGAGGTLQWFRRSDDLAKPWSGTVIDHEPTSHRLRWADVDGTGRKVLIDAPIMGPGTKAPEYDQAGARLLMYRVPADPARDRWPKQVIDTSLPVIHGLQVIDWDGDGREELLTASRQGVHLFHFQGVGDHLTWTKTHLCAGDQASSPAKGSSEVRVGHLKRGRRFIATIEPWHGNEVVVYHPPAAAGALWQRSVIDDSLDEGHALRTADLNGDGADEIIAGSRGKRHEVVLYRAQDPDGTRWERSVLDEGIACQGMSALDLGKGSHPGIVAIGGATHNIRLYTFP